MTMVILSLALMLIGFLFGSLMTGILIVVSIAKANNETNGGWERFVNEAKEAHKKNL